MSTHSASLSRRLAGAAALALAGAVAACGGGRAEPDRRAAVEIRGTDPGTGSGGAITAAPGTITVLPRAAAAPVSGGLGIADYGSYQAAVAREGETVAALAERVGLSASELAAYNGLTPTHSLRAGDELVLPSRPGGYTGETQLAAAAVVPAPETGPTVMSTVAPVRSGIETAPLPGTSPANPVDANPVDVVAEVPGGTDIDSALVPTGPSQTWSPDIAAAAIDRSGGLNADGTLGAPPSAVDPLPAEPETRRELASPDLGQYQTGATGSATPPPAPDTALAAVAPDQPAPSGPSMRLRRPVDGPVAVGFNKGSGPSRNDGVDFAAAAGAPVLAAADGEVALVSQSLGGLGTIVLLRHPNELLTVYGRIDGVTVQKGDLVQAGQRIGEVSNAAAPAEPRMHFEVRRGAESLDPMQFL